MWHKTRYSSQRKLRLDFLNVSWGYFEFLTVVRLDFLTVARLDFELLVVGW